MSLKLSSWHDYDSLSQFPDVSNIIAILFDGKERKIRAPGGGRLSADVIQGINALDRSHNKEPILKAWLALVYPALFGFPTNILNLQHNDSVVFVEALKRLMPPNQEPFTEASTFIKNRLSKTQSLQAANPPRPKRQLEPQDPQPSKRKKTDEFLPLNLAKMGRIPKHNGYSKKPQPRDAPISVKQESVAPSPPIEVALSLPGIRTHSHNIKEELVPVPISIPRSCTPWSRPHVPAPDPSPPSQKPRMVGCKIPIWAKSRQEVCESLEWFKSYQGGVYFKDDIAHGYLLSGFPSERDRFEHDGKLIISHGGGKAASIHKNKGVKEKRGVMDQTEQDKSIRALINNFTTKRPLVLLVDDAYKLFPYSLASQGAVYAVLGWYRVVSYWAEIQAGIDRKVRFKFAFQWVEAQGDPWWPFQTQMPTTFLSTNTIDQSQLCCTCQRNSPHVYDKGWACMYPSCADFLKCVNETTPCHLDQDLTYRRDFLALRTKEEDNMDPSLYSLTRQLPTATRDPARNTSAYTFTRGFHCKECGRLSCRVFWTGWKCLSCGHEENVDLTIFRPNDFYSLMTKVKDIAFEPSAGVYRDPSRSFVTNRHRGEVQTINFPDKRGRIHLISRVVNNLGEVNLIFQKYQEDAKAGKLIFRRWPMRAHQCKGDLLTHYFSQNTGQPYNYVGGAANTVSFHDAPAVQMARDYMHARLRVTMDQHLVEEFPTFNEVLSAAYMDKQSMAYHCDSEHGLGPVVAGLSLGAPALMEFRPKKSKMDNPSASLSVTSERAVVSIKLLHGDILVMEGSGVQDYYEHRVTPAGFRIAATARVIDPMKNVTPLGNKPAVVKSDPDAKIVLSRRFEMDKPPMAVGIGVR